MATKLQHQLNSLGITFTQIRNNEGCSKINSPVNLMFDLELIATENRQTPFETIWLLYTPCKFRQKSRQGKSKKGEEKSCQISTRERFTAGLPYPGIFYVYALTVISGFNGVYLRYDF